MSRQQADSRQVGLWHDIFDDIEQSLEASLVQVSPVVVIVWRVAFHDTFQEGELLSRCGALKNGLCDSVQIVSCVDSVCVIDPSCCEDGP